MPEPESSPSERPLVTFALIAYNQEKYIREAIAGALSQTYSPLEIILSDDCSSDRTFEIIEEMASRYGGPHQIILNRNNRNLGIGGHVNAVMALSQGQLIVVAAGDDISLSTRCEVYATVWLKEGCPTCSIFSPTIERYENGSEITKGLSHPDSAAYHTIVETGYHPVPGSSHAWSRETFSIFGELPDSLINEDTAIYFRNLLVGHILICDQPQVIHRIHGANTGSIGRSDVNDKEALLAYYKKMFFRSSTLAHSMGSDMRKYLENVSPSEYSSFRIALRTLERMGVSYLAGSRSMDKKLFSKVIAIARLIVSGPIPRKFITRIWHQLVFPRSYLYLKSKISRPEKLIESDSQCYTHFNEILK